MVQNLTEIAIYHNEEANISIGMLGLYTFAEEELMWFSQDPHFAHSSSTIGVSQGRYKRVGNILFFIIPENDLGFSARMPGSLWNFVFFSCQRTSGGYLATTGYDQIVNIYNR